MPGPDGAGGAGEAELQARSAGQLAALIRQVEGGDLPRGRAVAAPLAALLGGHPKEAALWDRASAAFGFDARQWQEYGQQLLMNGRVAEALAAFGRLLEDAGTRRKAFHLLMRANQAIENWPEALALAEQACSEFRDTPHFADFLAARAAQHLRSGMLEEAVADYTALSGLRPNEPAPYLGLVKAFCASRAFDAARAVGERARRMLVDERIELDIESVILRASGSLEDILALAGRLAGSGLSDEHVADTLRRLLHNRSSYFSEGRWDDLARIFGGRPAVADALPALRAGGSAEAVESSAGAGPEAVRRRSQQAADLVRAGREAEALEAAQVIAKQVAAWPSLPDAVSQLLEWREAKAGRIAAARTRYWTRRRRVRISDRSCELVELTVSRARSDVIVLAQVRNEMPNLPSFLAHHRALGVGRFVVVDNGSDDGTREFLTGQEDVDLLATRSSYRRAAAGSEWLDPIARRPEHRNTLCLRLDADERFVYPHCDRADVSRLWRFMQAAGSDAIAGPMIDMFPQRLSDLGDAADHVALSRFFDADLVVQPSVVPPYQEVSGGIRSTTLDGKPQNLGKVPGLRGGGTIERIGSHRCSPVSVSEVSCALLHYKFRPDFFQKAREEIARKEYAQNGQEWTRYLELETRRAADLRTGSSRLYASWRDLVDAGLMRSSPEWDRFALDSNPQ